MHVLEQARRPLLAGLCDLNVLQSGAKFVQLFCESCASHAVETCNCFGVTLDSECVSEHMAAKLGGER